MFRVEPLVLGLTLLFLAVLISAYIVVATAWVVPRIWCRAVSLWYLIQKPRDKKRYHKAELFSRCVAVNSFGAIVRTKCRLLVERVDYRYASIMEAILCLQVMGIPRDLQRMIASVALEKWKVDAGARIILLWNQKVVLERVLEGVDEINLNWSAFNGIAKHVVFTIRIANLPLCHCMIELDSWHYLSAVLVSRQTRISRQSQLVKEISARTK